MQPRTSGTILRANPFFRFYVRPHKNARLAFFGLQFTWLIIAGLLFALPFSSPSLASAASCNNLNFGPVPPSYALTGTRDSFTTGDFNNDGKPDLAALSTTGSNALSLNVLLNKGDGTFQPQISLLTGPFKPPMATADLNGDGKQDIVFGNLTVVLGNGDGTFQLPVNYNNGTNNSYSLISTFDFNGDNKPDLAVSSDNFIRVAINNGNGTFKTPVDYPAASNLPLQATDFNGDGKIDLVTGDLGLKIVNVLLGNGDGTFQAALTAPAGINVFQLATGDFNGDNKADLIASNTQAGDTNDISLILGNGDGTFQAPTIFSMGAGADPYNIKARDINGDGKTDFVTSNRDSTSIFLGNGNGTFQPPLSYDVVDGKGTESYIISALEIADFDGDNKLDLAFFGTSAVILRGNGDGTFQAQRTITGFGSLPDAVATGDFNKDGKLDAVATIYPVTNATGPHVLAIFLGNGNGTFQAPLYPATDANKPFSVVVSDFNNDGNPDLATTGTPDTNQNFITVYLGNGDGSFQAGVKYLSTMPTLWPGLLRTGDINGDGKPDLVTWKNDQVIVLLNNGNGTFQTPLFFATSSGAIITSISVADFNGDNKDDIAVVSLLLNDMTILLNNGANNFQVSVYPIGTGQQAVTSRDFNGDGKTDMVVVLRNAGTIAVVLGNGNGTFQPATKYPGYTDTIAITNGDFDGDNKADVLITNLSSKVSILLGNGNGTFQNLVDFKTANPASVVTGDFNGDNKLDILSSNSNGNTLTLLLNQYGTNTTVSNLMLLPSVSSTPVNQTISLNVSGIDNCASVLANYRGTVTFSSSDPNATLPANYTFTAGDKGSKTFNVTFKTPGKQTVTVTDITTRTITGSVTIDVTSQVTPTTPFNLLPSTVRVASTLNLGTNPLIATSDTPKIGDSSSVLISVAGANGIPSNATGVVGILTNIGCEAGGNLRLWSGNTISNTVNLNVAGSSLNIPGATSALNLSTGFVAPLDSSGKLYLGWGSAVGKKCGYALDITGYLTSGSPISLLPSAARLAATFGSNAVSPLVSTGDTPKVGDSSSVQLTAGGTNGIPANASGIVGILTNVQCNSGGNLRFWTGNSVPTSVNLNVPGSSLAIPNTTVALNLSTNFIAPLDSNGKVYLGWASTVGKSCGFAVDVIGYLSSAANFTVLPSTARVASTITTGTKPLTATGSTPKVGDSSSTLISVAGTNGIPASAKGVIGIVTNVSCEAGGNLRFWTGSTIPTSVNLNVPGSSLAIPGATTALNLSTGFVASLDSTGKFYLGWASTAGKNCGFAVDIVGYFN